MEVHDWSPTLQVALVRADYGWAYLPMDDQPPAYCERYSGSSLRQAHYCARETSLALVMTYGITSADWVRGGL